MSLQHSGWVRACKHVNKELCHSCSHLKEVCTAMAPTQWQWFSVSILCQRVGLIAILTIHASGGDSPISSAMALKGQVWLVELVWRNLGQSCKWSKWRMTRQLHSFFSYFHTSVCSNSIKWLYYVILYYTVCGIWLYVQNMLDIHVLCDMLT